MKKLLTLITTVVISLSAYATHNMSGDIYYSYISGYTYQFTIRTFTNTCQTQADRCELTLHIGNDSIVLPRINEPSSLCPSSHDGVQLCTCVKVNIYTGTYTFAGPGIYQYYMQDANMNTGICNVTNSVSTPFTLTGEMIINSINGYANTPQYEGVALMTNNVGVVSTYNPAVVNTNGDSLYFDFAFPTGVTLPPASTSFSINHQTGVITWDAPNVICNYSIFVTMKYYRNISGLYYYIGTNMQEIYTDNTCISDMLVNELSNDSGVSIAPNPFSELTSITFSEEQKNTSLKVMNVLGECIHQSTINTSQCTIDMSGMPKGIYFVRIKTEKGIVNRKIIKN